MDESILQTIKKMLGLSADYDVFDLEIRMYINSAFQTLFQLGVGADPFLLTSAEETWSDFLEDQSALGGLQTYIYIKVKLLFDPPANSSVIEALNAQAAELEWRIFAESDRDPMDTPLC